MIGVAGSVAGAKLALERTIEYCKERTAFGKPIGSFQANRHRIAELMTKVVASQQLVYDTALAWERGEYPVAQISMAKLFAGLVVNRVMNTCMQLFGGYGYATQAGIERAWRDARLLRIGAGTDEVMREVIAKTMGL